MRYRQIHLDFHTSEKITDIGRDFTKEQFQDALKVGHVNSITLFSKCHHGWAYHPSMANEIHPHLKFDLLKEQISAAHEIGVKTPVYLSAGFDEKMARRHPEWLVRCKDETIWGAKNFTEPGYHVFCFNSPYLEYLAEQVHEVCENYDVDGIFMDITGVVACYCQNCVRDMLLEGKDPYNTEHATEFAEKVYANYTKKIRETIDKVKSGLPVFHNSGHIRRGRRDLAEMNTHLELESLPTGGWGYDHFPLSAAYARTLGMEFLGMTGKFHTSWGEFGGFKHPNALRYEVALSCVNGAKCSIGDQLHPYAMMDMATYKLIGEAYEGVEKREEWLKDAENIVDIAMISNEAVCNYYAKPKTEDGNKSDIGCVRILLEGKCLFNVVDLFEDFSKYKLIIMPDYVLLDNNLKEKLDRYLKNGGKILATGKSGLNHDQEEFFINLGCKFVSECEYKPSYIRPKFEISSLANSSFVMYGNCQKIVADMGEEIAIVEKPYFNRSTFEFCSHLHTPTSLEKYQPAMVETQNTVYIAYDIFRDYAVSGGIVCKEIVQYAIDYLLKDKKTVEADIGAQGIVTVTEQKTKNRKNVHLLYASPVKRGENIEIIEDILPVYNTRVRLRTSNIPRKIYLAPEMREIDFEFNDNIVEFTVPKIECWQIVVLDEA